MRITSILQSAVLGATLIAATSGVASAGRIGGGGGHGGGAVSHGGGSISHGGSHGGSFGHGPVVRGGGVIRGGGYHGGYYGGRGYYRGGVWIGPSYGYGYTCDPYYDECVEPVVAPVYVAPRVVVRRGFRRW